MLGVKPLRRQRPLSYFPTCRRNRRRLRDRAVRSKGPSKTLLRNRRFLRFSLVIGGAPHQPHTKWSLQGHGSRALDACCSLLRRRGPELGLGRQANVIDALLILSAIVILGSDSLYVNGLHPQAFGLRDIHVACFCN